MVTAPAHADEAVPASSGIMAGSEEQESYLVPSIETDAQDMSAAPVAPQDEIDDVEGVREAQRDGDMSLPVDDVAKPDGIDGLERASAGTNSEADNPSTSETTPQEGTLDEALLPHDAGAQQAAMDDASGIPSEDGSEAEGASGETTPSPADPAPEDPDVGTKDAPATEDGQASGTSEPKPQQKKKATPKPPTKRFALECDIKLGRVVEVKGGSKSTKAKIQLAGSSNTSQQRWKLVRHGSAYYVQNCKTGLVLQIAGGKAKVGASIVQGKRSGKKTQLWIPEYLSDGTWRLKSARNPGLSLALGSSSAKKGTGLRLVKTGSSKRARFNFREVSPKVAKGSRVLASGTYLISAKGNAQRLLASVSTKLKSNVALAAKKSVLLQRFNLTYKEGYYTISNVLSSLVLGVKDSSPVRGTNVAMEKSSGKKNQQWRIDKLADGTYRLTNRGTGLTLSLANSKLTSGTNIQGEYAGTSSKQRWSLKRVTLVKEGFYQLSSLVGGEALAIKDASRENGAKAVHATKSKTLEQTFRVAEELVNGKSVLMVRNANSAKWLKSSSGKVVQATKKGAMELVWTKSGIVLREGSKYAAFDKKSDKVAMTSLGKATTLNPTSRKLLANGAYQFKSLWGVVVDVKNASKTSTELVTASASNAMTQVWSVRSTSNGSYVLENSASGLVLGESKTGDARQTAHADERQEWQVEWDEDNGGIVLVNAATGNLLAASSKVGEAVVASERDGSVSQSWCMVTAGIATLRNRIAEVAEHFATDNKHGYSQPNRGTGGIETITLSDGAKVEISAGDVDCSELVRQCVNAILDAKDKIDYMWTGDELYKLQNAGFERIAYSSSQVQRGDILWYAGHTGVALGNGLLADAAHDEYGGIYGSRSGDNTEEEVAVRSVTNNWYSWTYILRYVG